VCPFGCDACLSFLKKVCVPIRIARLRIRLCPSRPHQRPKGIIFVGRYLRLEVRNTSGQADPFRLSQQDAHDLAVSAQNDAMEALKSVGKTRFFAQIAEADFGFERERIFGPHGNAIIPDRQFFGDLSPIYYPARLGRVV
jgi:hypothetical protein